MAIGIYEVQIGNYFYHGSSKNIEKRMRCHKNKLKNNKHPNPKMQSIYDKYKEFKYDIILTCEEKDLEYLEQCIIDAHIGDKACMNLAVTVGNPMRGRKQTEEHKAKIGAANKGRSTNLGIIRSEETKLNMKEAAFKREAKKREIRNASSK